MKENYLVNKLSKYMNTIQSTKKESHDILFASPAVMECRTLSETFNIILIFK